MSYRHPEPSMTSPVQTHHALSSFRCDSAPIGVSVATGLMGFLAATSTVVNVDGRMLGAAARRRRRLANTLTAAQTVSSVTGNVCVAAPSTHCDFGPSKPTQTQTSSETVADAVSALLSFLQEEDMPQYGITMSETRFDGYVWTIEKGRELLESLCRRDNRNVEEVVGAMKALEFVQADGTNGRCVTINESGTLTLYSTTCLDMEKNLAFDVTKAQLMSGLSVSYGFLLFASISAWYHLTRSGFGSNQSKLSD